MATEARDFDRWVRIELAASPGGIELRYLDETGRRSSEDGGRHVLYLGGPSFFAWHLERPLPLGGEFRLPVPELEAAGLFSLAAVATFPDTLGAWIEEAYKRFEQARYHVLPSHGGMTMPWLLPVFVVPPPGLAALPWEEWLRWGVLASLNVEQRCVAIRYRPSGAPRPPMGLPLRLYDARKDAASTAILQSRNWYSQSEEVRKHGIEFVDGPTLRSADADLHAPHILIHDTSPSALPPASRHDLRLTVEIKQGLEGPRPFAGGSAVLRIRPAIDPAPPEPSVGPGAGAGQATSVDPDDPDLDPVVNLVYGLAHDHALHEIVYVLRSVRPDLRFDLCCDPASNHDLRLSSSMSDLRTRMLSLLDFAGPGSRFLSVDRAREAAREMTFNFTYESTGLTDMARAIAGAAANRGVAPADPGGPGDFGDAGDGEAFGARRVEVMLDCYDAFGKPQPMTRDRMHGMQTGWRYRLGVQIGLPFPEFSVFDKPPEPIDAAIDWERAEADDGVVEIEACVFGKDFRVLSPTTQKLSLSRRGGPSRLVHFELKAPQTEREHDLRLAFYAQNNLLQSFQLKAWVFPDAPVDMASLAPGDRGIDIRLTSSAVNDLADAGTLRRRDVSIAFNDDAQPGRHTVMIKGDEGGFSFQSSPDQTSDINAQYRATLQAVDERRISWEIAVRDLAAVGSQLWKRMAAACNTDTLRKLRSESGTVQFARLSSVLGMPWQLVYDFRMPTREAFKAPHICRATTPVVAPFPESGARGCRHFPDEDVICIEGFWAHRHFVELISEEIGAPRPDAPPPKRADVIEAPSPHPLLTFGGSLGLALEQQAASVWDASLPKRFHRLCPDDAPIANALWRPDLLPALLVLLGHLHKADRASNLERRLYACEPTDQDDHEVSAGGLITAKDNHSPWTGATRPIVMLLACESARQDLSELMNLTDAFLRSGAAGVIGTEWTVSAGDALAFGTHAVEALLRGKATLGEFMRDHYRAELASGTGVPMLFTAYGNADLRVASGSIV